MFMRDDFGAVQKRWDAFWTGQNQRPLYSVVVLKEGSDAAPAPPYLSAFNGDYQTVADMLLRWADCREFYGEAMPVYALSFGADDFAAFCGGDLKMSPNGDTSWPVHFLSTLKNAKIAFDVNGRWWTKMTEFYHALKNALGETVCLSVPPLGAGLDAIVGMYGAKNLLTDMIDDPEAVLDAVRQVNTAYSEAYKACVELFEIKKYGSSTRHGMYSTGVAGVPQCDVSCMISPGMFEKFAVPCLSHEMDLLDAVEYHLDGPAAIKHLERLVQIDKLRVVQWVAGAGEAETQDWTHLYKRVVSLGKGLIMGGGPERVAQLQDELNSKDIFFSVGGIRSRAQAEDFLGRMRERWGAKE